jgi:hypothetical protein
MYGATYGLPTQAGNFPGVAELKPVQFVILNAPRTGSNYLCTVLNSHPEILCHHEIFNPHVVGVARHLQLSEFRMGSLEERNADPIRFLDRVWALPMGRSRVGFKLCWRQNEAVYRFLLKESGIRKIVLKRRNRVRTYVSLALARHTTEWVTYDDSAQPGPRPAIQIDPRAFLDTVAFNNDYYNEIEGALRESDQAFQTLYYEDVISGSGIAQALEFLGVEPQGAGGLRGQTWKLTNTPLPELVLNFDQLAAELRGTEFEPELELP